MNLGPMSGLDIAQEVRKLRPDLPVVLISAYLTAEIHELARAVGVRRVLAKAATFDDLIRDLSSDETLVETDATLIDHTPVAGRQLNVLVVDDDAAVRRFLCEVLQMDGHVTKEAANGDDALRQLAESPTDLIITDLCMPEKEGIEMIRELRESGARTKIIAISGILGQPALAAAKMLGADAVIPKPVGADALLNAVAHLATA
jgi:CheY-like chemotaxis protein